MMFHSYVNVYQRVTPPLHPNQKFVQKSQRLRTVGDLPSATEAAVHGAGASTGG